MRKALVQISGQEQHSAFTGADGRFQIDNVMEGDYFASAQKPGFGGQGPGFIVAPVGGGGAISQNRFHVDASSEPLLIKLVPEASIKGRVDDENGEPIEDLQILCLRATVINGHKVWQNASSSSTDERGFFTLGNLSPGAYLLKTGLKPEFPGLSESSGGSALQRVYPSQYYPGSANQASAQAISVQPGETAQVNLSVSPVRSFMISGKTAVAGSASFATIEDEQGEQVSQTFTDPRTGIWTARAIPAGSWKVVLRAQDNLYAEQVVQVTSSDVKNIQLVPQALPSIPLMIRGVPTEGVQSLTVFLRPHDTAHMGDSYPTQQDDKSLFQQVLPGKYRTIVPQAGRECVDSITAGSVDLTRSMLTIIPGSQPPPIQLATTENCAGVIGKVQGNMKTTNGFVILIPESLAQEPLIMQSAVPDGSFTISGLAPGNYHAYAFSSIDDLEYANPDALAELSGESLSLHAGEQTSVTLKLNIRK